MPFKRWASTSLSDVKETMQSSTGKTITELMVSLKRPSRNDLWVSSPRLRVSSLNLRASQLHSRFSGLRFESFKATFEGPFGYLALGLESGAGEAFYAEGEEAEEKQGWPAEQHP